METCPANSSSTSLNVDTDSVSSQGKKALKEGAVQMTSLTTLLSHHRYLFLYNDTLVVSKQKSAFCFKLKEKLRLDRVWVASSNSADSFLLGWPFCNYLVHFRNRNEKEDWFELFSYCVQQCLRPVSTTISMDINVRGRKQVIRRRIDNGKKSGELVVETAADLGLSHTSYELRLVVGEGTGKALQGPENVYVVIMSEIERQGIRLSESQRQTLDACPIANARLILSNIKSSKSSSPMQIVNSIKKRVLQRTDSRGFFGRELDGPTPPQPVMSIVDHLRMHGCDTEGVFRKSPKQSTLKECRSEMERGQVPDYAKYGTHVLASVLKDYLRSIPGKILLSGNYDLWIKEVANEADHEKKIAACKSLLKLLPTAHSILLANVLKLLNKIANSPTSKMTASALSVCLAPSFLESSEQSTDPLENGKKVPLLVEFLILNAAEVMPPGFSADNVFSLLNPLDHNANHLCSPVPTCSDDEGSQKTPIIEEMGENSPSLSSLRDEIPAERPPRFLEVIHENDGVLSFSDSDEEAEPVRRPLSRASFRSETLRQQKEDTVTKEEPLPEKVVLIQKVEDRKQPDTPRSPCLKRIHFQRKQEQVQNRTNELFKHDSRLDIKPDRIKDEKTTDEPPSRKESREEATQTSDCGLSRLNDCESRFPAFRGSTAHSNEAHEPSGHSRLVRKETVVVDCLPRSTTTTAKDICRPEESQKPTVHVHPFTPDVQSQEPILRTITERLQSLRVNQLAADSSPRLNRRSHVVPEEVLRFRDSYIDCGESPRFSRSIFEPADAVPSPKNTRKSALILENRVSREDLYVPLYKPHDLHVKQETNHKYQNPHLITERFSSYCIEPPSDHRPNKDSLSKKPEIVRSASHRDEKSNNFQRDAQRATSVKNNRRGDTCVGMDPLEINWSVRQLKTLFQDCRAPSIDTDYTVG
ncbi:hypothetical protein RB195_004964 [Necator americanus]|uniref:Rho-GAP domain-containing protein n=1 Tax=Necator americanus TaxID=51031 RepID=A0ABR1BNK8_NECAM